MSNMRKITTLVLAAISVSCAYANPSLITRKVGSEQMLNRLLSYVTIESQSDDESPLPFPMTEGQKQMAQYVYDEVRSIAGDEVKVTLSDDYYVYIDIRPNVKKDVPSILFLGHLDVTPEAPGKGIRPLVHRNYDGGKIVLTGNQVLDPNQPKGAHLKDLIGKTIVTSDGTTLLGADDKTGCAILVTLVEEIVNNPDFKHGRVMICLSQNEDIGLAAERYDPSVFNCRPDVVIDMDGDTHDKYSVGNFSAIGQAYHFKGNDVHASHGKELKYADALTAAATFISLIPVEMNPANRDGDEGYIHCFTLYQPKDENGKEISTEWIVKARLRFFNTAEGRYQQQLMTDNMAKVQQLFPHVEVSKIEDRMQYDNVKYSLPPFLPAMIEKAAAEAGMPMTSRMERAGTTSAMMLAKYTDLMPGGSGVYSGQQAEHSTLEWCCIEELLALVNFAENLIAEVMNK